MGNNIEYKPFGKPTGMTTGSGGRVNNRFSDCDCLEVANPGEPMEQAYIYDNNQNLTSIRGTNTPWFNQDFSYDALNRLTNATGPYGTIGYTYDRVGNRVTRTTEGPTDTYTYITGTNKLQEITAPNPVTYTHDANGNITGMRDKTLVYNQNNRLQRVEEGGTVLGEYAYSGLGQRITKTVGETMTVFHYDFDGNIIGESESDGTFTTEYLYLGASRTAKVDVVSGNMYYYHNNYLGTPLLMTDDNGAVVWEADYNPFGEATVNPSSTLVNNFRFPGKYYDTETGLHYNYHRYYDPRTGKYLTPDPIGLSGGINFYTYADNNPIVLLDPKGLVCGSWWNDWLVPDTPDGYDFTNCCQGHDNCYKGKNNQCFKGKGNCDEEFYKCMVRYCRRNHLGDRKCLNRASEYWNAVYSYEPAFWSFYNARKESACNQCP